MASSLPRRALAEGVGTALLLATIVGSGIMGERLSGGSVGLALLANSVATGAALIALILAIGEFSGAHMNPAVTVAEALRGAFPRRDVPGYLLAQWSGAFGGVILAHAMFGEPLLAESQRSRFGFGTALAEFVATFGLVFVIRGAASAGRIGTALAVGSYITAAYWFTSSTSFANPAVTLARAATNTFSGIRPLDVPAFVAAQLLGAFAGSVCFSRLTGGTLPGSSIHLDGRASPSVTVNG